MWHLNLQNRTTGLDYSPIPQGAIIFTFTGVSDSKKSMYLLLSVGLSVLFCSALWPWFPCWSLQHCTRLHPYWWPLHQWGAAPSLWLEGTLSQPVGLLQLLVSTRIYRTSVQSRYSLKIAFTLACIGFFISHRCVISHSKMSLRATFSTVQTKPSLAQRARLKWPRCPSLTLPTWQLN